MRICIVTPYSTPGWGGGVATHLKFLVKGLIEYNQQVTVLSGAHPQVGFLKGTIEGATCQSILGVLGNEFNPQFLEASRKLFDKINREKPFDIILSVGSSAYGLLREKSLEIPVVSLLYQFKIIHLFNSFLGVNSLRTLAIYSLKTIPRIFYNAFFQELPFYRRCQGITCGAKHISEQIKKYYRINPNKIRTIPYWIDNNRFRPDAASRIYGRKQLGLPDGSFIYLIVNRIQATKGIKTGLKAFSKAIKNISNAYMVVAGGGNKELLNSYKVLTRELGIDKKTIFIGMVAEEFLPSIYNIADVFIMPSPLLEVLPYTILEAMATGLPIIATQRPGSYEALGDSGVYVGVRDNKDLANAMLRLYIDADLRKDYAQRNLKRFQENFTMEKLVYKFIDFLREVTSKV